MKKSILILFTIFTAISGFAQNIDWENAPMNPIPQGADLKYHNLKGDVMQGSIIHYFTRDGKWFSYDGLKQVKKDAQGRVVQHIDKERTTTYQYDSKGNLIASSGSTYEYDSKNRLIKANHKYETIQYSYKKDGAVLIVSEMNTYDGKTSETEYHYKNGLKILQKTKNGKSLKYEYEYDNKGNWISMVTLDIETNKPLYNEYSKRPLKPKTRSLIYYTDYDKGVNALSVVLKDLTEGAVAGAPAIPYLFINGKEIENQIIARLADDYVFYDPISTTYYIARNAYRKDNKYGQKFAVEKLHSGSEVVLLTKKNSVKIFAPKMKGTKNESWTYLGEKTFYAAFHQTENIKYFFDKPINQVADKTIALAVKNKLKDQNIVWYYYSRADKQLQVYDNEKLVLEEFTAPGKIAGTEDVVVAINGTPKYVLINLKNAGEKELSKARYFNPATDKIQSANNDNTTPTTTTAGTANTSGQTTTENDVPIHKITATFTADTKLTVRKLDDNTFHYYQNDKRINAPLRQEVITKDELLVKGQRLDLFCSYGDDYNFYCPHDVNDIEKNALYSMFQNKKINYLYVYQNNVGTLSLNYHNEMLDKKDYEVYTPKGNENYMFIKTKKDNDFFVAEKKQLSKYRKDVLKSVNVPNSNNYLLILQDNDEFVFLEPGKPTHTKGWRLEHKEDTEKYYLINDKEKIKYYAYNYNKLLKQGFEYLHKDTY